MNNILKLYITQYQGNTAASTLDVRKCLMVFFVRDFSLKKSNAMNANNID